MYKYFILVVTIGGFIFAAEWDNTVQSIEASDQNNNQYYFVEGNDFKEEAGRRRGKGNRGRRGDGGGLR